MAVSRISPTIEGAKRRHRGDIMSREKRSIVMSRIKGKDTGPERLVAAAMRRLRIRFEPQARDLPGRPDFVSRRWKIAVFVDGDFWHGWRFPLWADKLSPAWEAKIANNRARDRRNHRKLRRLGWTVVRIWEHQILKDLEGAMDKVRQALNNRRVGRQQ